TWTEERHGIDEPRGVDDCPGHAVEVNPGRYEGTARDRDGPGFGLDRDGRRTSVSSRTDFDGVTGACRLDGCIDAVELCCGANGRQLRPAPQGRDVERAGHSRLLPRPGRIADAGDQAEPEDRRQDDPD